ncbi:hypothetical protein [Solicola sp. PLA-1-18]
MTEHRPPESWGDLQARLEREWQQALAQLADARARGDFAGWKPSFDR